MSQENKHHKEVPVELPVEVRLEEFWTKYKNTIVIGVVLIIAVALISGLYNNYTSTREENATLSINTAVDAGNIEAVGAVVDSYKGTKAAAQALLLIADMNFQKAQYVQSSELYQRFIREYPQHELFAAAVYGMGSCQQAMGKLDEAIQTYRGLQKSHPREIWTFHAMINAANCYEAKADPSNARKIYQEILSSQAPDTVKLQAEYSMRRLG